VYVPVVVPDNVGEVNVLFVNVCASDVPTNVPVTPCTPVVTLSCALYAAYNVLWSPFQSSTVGIPVVAYNHAIERWTSVIEKYFPKRSIFSNEIRDVSKMRLDKFEPYEETDILLKSQSNKGEWE